MKSPTNYIEYSDTKLVQLLQAGDRMAFTEIYNRYWDKLFYKAGKKTGDLFEAEEIVQELLLDIWKRRERLQINGELNHYLGAALKFKVINLQARQQRAAQYQRHQLSKQPMADHSTQEWLNYSALQNTMASLVSSLPEKCKLAFELREQGFSQKEIAGKMNVSENTVETHIGRALKHLRTGLSQFFSHMFTMFLFL